MRSSSPAGGGPAPVLADRDVRRLRDGASAADAAGRLQPRQLALIHRRGWMRMLAPRSCGGAEMPLPAAVRLLEAIAAADGSCGWVVTLGAGAGWFAGFLPPSLAREVIGTRRLCIAGSGAATGFAEREGEGWRITGRWGFATGAPIATHFTFNAVLRERGEPLAGPDGEPLVRAFIIPAADVEVLPEWNAVGLRATASDGYRIQASWVPENHAFDIEAARATADGPLYRFPFLAFALVTLAANLGGMAAHFLELAEPVILHRKLLPGDGRVGELPHVKAQLRRAREHLAASCARFHEQLDAAWEHLEAGGVLGAADADALQAVSLARVRAAREVVDGLHPYCGLRAAERGADIELVWRDFHTATQHGLLLPPA